MLFHYFLLLLFICLLLRALFIIINICIFTLKNSLSFLSSKSFFFFLSLLIVQKLIKHVNLVSLQMQTSKYTNASLLLYFKLYSYFSFLTLTPNHNPPLYVALHYIMEEELLEVGISPAGSFRWCLQIKPPSSLLVRTGLYPFSGQTPQNATLISPVDRRGSENLAFQICWILLPPPHIRNWWNLVITGACYYLFTYLSIRLFVG